MSTKGCIFLIAKVAMGYTWLLLNYLSRSTICRMMNYKLGNSSIFPILKPQETYHCSHASTKWQAGSRSFRMCASVARKVAVRVGDSLPGKRVLRLGFMVMYLQSIPLMMTSSENNLLPNHIWLLLTYAENSNGCYRCKCVAVMAEDRILRPEESLVVRDDDVTIAEVESMAKAPTMDDPVYLF